MDKETEKRLKKKIMAGEELTEEEKKYFQNYDEWKVQHDQARKETIEGLRWNAWPALFLCAFFLFSTAVNNFRYLKAVSWQAETSIYVVTIVSAVLGVGGVVGAFWMKHQAALIHQRANEANSLILAEDQEEANSSETENESLNEEEKSLNVEDPICNQEETLNQADEVSNCQEVSSDKQEEIADN